MPGSDPLWYCHECNAEMRPTIMSPEPLCASCNSSFIEQLPPSDATEVDDPRAFNAMNRLFGQFGTPREHDEHDHDHNIGLAIDPVGQLLGAVLGMRNLGPATPPRGTPSPSPPDLGSGSGRPTIQIRRDSEQNTRSRTGGSMRFSFRSGSGSDAGGGSGLFGGFTRREERREERAEPPGIEEFLTNVLQGLSGGPNANQGQGQGQRPPPLLQNMLMGLLGAGIGHPGVGMGAAGGGRFGDYVLNQEALDQIITQLMDANHSVPVPVPEDMISSWPRTILTPGNPLENQDCAVCKESFTFNPDSETDSPQPDSSSKKPSGDEAQPQEAVTLPCKHSFHVECIEPWVKVKGTCPVCRYELVPQGQQGQENNTPGGRGGSSGSNNGPGRTGSGSRHETDRDGQGRDSPMPPGAYTLD